MATESIKHGNTRAARAARFLERAPTGATQLVVSYEDGDDWPTMQSWPVADVTGQLGGLVDELVQSHAEDVGHHVRARAQWCDADGRALATKPMRASPSSGETQQSYDGSSQSLVIQAQRHTEAMTRLYVDAQGKATSALVGVLERMAEETGRAEGRAQAAESRAAAVEEAAARVIEEAQALAPANDPTLEKVLALVQLHLMRSGQVPPQ